MEKLEMNYEDLLNKAIEKLPKKEETRDRFGIPEAILEVSGNRSIFKNFGEVADKLRREHAHLSKYLSKELATAGNVQAATLVFQGNIRREILQRKIEDYIKEFVYCKECGEPDTRLVKRDRITIMICEACGAKHPLRSI